MKSDLNNALQKTADIVAKAAEAAMEHINDWQQIKNYLRNRLTEIELTDDQKEKLKRYNSIYTELLSNKYDDVELPAIISKLYNVSEAQAYKDISATRELYSSIIKLEKLFEVRLRIDNCKRMLRKAEELNDVKGYAMIDKTLEKYIAMLPDEDTKVGDDFIIPELQAVFNPALLGVPLEFDMAGLLVRINEKRNLKLNTEMFEQAEEVKEDAGN